MKKHVSIALVVALVLCMTVTGQVELCGAVETVNIGITPNYYYFVGFSNIAKTGNAGQSVMNNACKSKYGQGARMCTTQEILTSWKLPTTKSTVGWVNPSHIQVIVVTTGPTNQFLATDAPSGLSWKNDNSLYVGGALNCNRWYEAYNDDYMGITLNGITGRLDLTLCTTELPIACCNR